MTDQSYPQGDTANPSPDVASDSSELLPPPEARAPWHQILLSLVRAAASLLIVVWIYVSFDPAFDDNTGMIFMAVGLVVFVAFTIWQGRRIVHAQYPGLRAMETLATIIPMFLIVFAGTYFVASGNNPQAFNEPLNKGSAIYFTIVVLSTTGFGDIVPKTGFARAAVNTQMLIDLFFVAMVLRFVLTSVNKGRERRAQGIPAKSVIPRGRRSKNPPEA